METGYITAMAYDMNKEYQRRQTQGGAIEAMKDLYPGADLNVLHAMWLTLDAHFDIDHTD